MKNTFLLYLATPLLFAQVQPIWGQIDKSPSKDMVQWLGTKTSVETLIQYDYVGNARTDLGDGTHRNVPESQMTIRELITERCLRAFLFREGLEWERLSFSAPSGALEPHQLQVMDVYLATDFRFSRKDMIRLQARPGLYSDFNDVDSSDFNVPFVMAYSHMVSHTFQWAIGASLNPFRRPRWLGGGGFRWQMSDRWKFQAMLPEPRIEYRARDDLHLSAGGEFLGESYRTARNFGSERGNSRLNSALVDYQEIRVGAGASWNWKPLLEFNLHAGYMLSRSFNYHEGGPVLTSHPAPYVSINIQSLFEVGPHDDSVLETKGAQFQAPILKEIKP